MTRENLAQAIHRGIEPETALEKLIMLDQAFQWSISILDENLIYQYISASTYEALGLNHDDIKPGDPLSKMHELLRANGLLNDDIMAKNELSAEAQEKRGPTSRFTKVMKFADGRTMKLVRTRLSNGYTVSVSGDISELVEKEKLLENSLRLGQAGYIEHNLATGDVILSETMRRHFSAQDYSKVQEEGLKGLVALTHPDDRKTLIDALKTALKSGHLFTYECRTKTRRNEWRWSLANGEIVRNPKGTPIKVKIFVRDTTDKIKRAQEIEHAKDQALAASQAKSEFLANMSHEIRTPMNGILGMAELLTNSNINDQNKEHVDVIYKSANALLTIINDVLDFSKIEAGALELDPIAFNMREMINDVASLMTQPAQAKELELIVNYDTQAQSHFIGDEGRLRQVVTNLINNAIKFTKEGHIVVDITVTGGREAANIINISVKDTGIGIEPDKIDTIFENFTQADSSTTRLYGGTGLGLSISRKIVEMMNGRIDVESTFGEGSEFRVTIPLPVDKNASPEAYDTTVLKDKRVLIVDDIDVNCNVLSSRLRNWDMKTIAVYDAIDALTIIKSDQTQNQEFDLIISDYLMPGMNGLEFAKVLQRKSSITDIPIIMLSSCDRPVSTPELRAANIRKFLMKPARESVLYDAIVKVLSAETQQTTSIEHDTPSTSEPKKDKVFILVAEDFSLNQDVIRLMLADTVYEPEFANNGREAVDMYMANPSRYPVIIMDISMPIVDGYQASQMITQYETENNLPHKPILALTGHALKHDREKCLAAGMTDYLSKPIRQELLISKLEELRNCNQISDQRQSVLKTG